MEKERCDLLEELQSVKAKLSSAEGELEEKNDQLKQLKTNYDKETKSLKQEIVEVASTLFNQRDALLLSCRLYLFRVVLPRVFLRFCGRVGVKSHIKAFKLHLLQD